MSDFFKQICDDIERMASLAVKLKLSEGANVKFEKCEAVGLRVFPDHEVEAKPNRHSWIRADEVEKLLREGLEVFFQKDTHSTGMSYCCDVKDESDTHLGLLVAVKPIAKHPEKKQLDLLQEATGLLTKAQE